MKRAWLVTLLIGMSVLSAVLALGQSHGPEASKSEIDGGEESRLDARVAALEGRVNALAARVEVLERARDEQRRASEDEAKRIEEAKVLVTPLGGLYHRAGCRYVGSDSREISLKEAKAQGYKPCRTCKAPE